MPIDLYGLMSAVARRRGDAFGVRLPGGGGDHHSGHRCAGEWLTIALMTRATRLLAEMSYEVPPQDLRVSRRKVPALPNSGFAVTNVRCPTATLRSPGSDEIADAGHVATSANPRSATWRFP